MLLAQLLSFRSNLNPKGKTKDHRARDKRHFFNSLDLLALNSFIYMTTNTEISVIWTGARVLLTSLLLLQLLLLDTKEHDTKS